MDCPTVIRQGVAPETRGLCPGCADKRMAEVRTDAKVRKQRTELYSLQDAVLRVLPYLRAMSERSWPHAHHPLDLQAALEDLRRATGDLG